MNLKPRSWRTDAGLNAAMDAYRTAVASDTDDELRRRCNQIIWLSAYASNNAKSDYHWQCDLVAEECDRRGKPEIYAEAHAKLVEDAR